MMDTITLEDDWGRTAEVRTVTFIETDRKGRVKGCLVGETGSGTLFRFVARLRGGTKPCMDLWESEDGYIWGRDLRLA